MAFASGTVILCPLAIWFSRKFWSWMVFFGSLFDQFVSSFDRADRLSISQFDAVRFIDFSAKDFDRWVQWIRDSCFVFDFWQSKIKVCWSWCYYCVDFGFWNALLDLSFFACLMMAQPILLFFCDFSWRSLLHLFICGHWPYLFRSDNGSC